jgi:hypothetical protein
LTSCNAAKAARAAASNPLSVLLAPHPEVREVVDELTEDHVTVGPVRRGVEDVPVPHLVDDLARHDVGVRVEQVEGEERAVLALQQVELCLTQSLTVVSQQHQLGAKQAR